MARPTHFMTWIMGLEASALKGGEGSGNFGHAGRPGEVGGSQPQGEGGPAEGAGSQATEAHGGGGAPEFDKNNWDQVPIPNREAEWARVGIEEQDRLANSKVAIPRAIKQIIGDRKRPPFSGDPRADIEKHLAQMDDLAIGDADEKIKTTVFELDDILTRLKVAPEVRYKLGMDVVETLAAQEYESMTRQLGDHGIHHLKGNIDTTMQILDAVPGKYTDRDRAAAYLACVYHDSGYLTEPGRTMVLDSGHARWSAEHYDNNVRKLVAKAIGSRQAMAVTHMITTHAATDIDWEEDPVASAVRVADNVALFHREKLPGLFRYVPGNLNELVSLRSGKTDLPSAKANMVRNIRGKNFPPMVEKALLKAVEEVSSKTGDFTLGMLGGYVESIEWSMDHLKINLKENKASTLQNKLLDLGQKQFSKFAKTYKVDPKQFLTTLKFMFSSPDNKPLLEGAMV